MFSTRPTRVSFALALASLLLFGCSDDDEVPPRYRADVDPDVSSSSQVSTLDDDALQRVCRSYDAHVEANVSFEAISYIACLPAAIVLGGSRDGCEDRLRDCMALFPEPIKVSATGRAEEVCVDRLRSCDASIEALEGCVDVNLGLALDIIDNWSCRGIDDDRLKEAARAMNTVSVCTNVDAPCAEAVAFGPD